MLECFGAIVAFFCTMTPFQFIIKSLEEKKAPSQLIKKSWV